MTPHVAFLRGMNLGSRRISNEELRAHCAAIGLADARVFRASGNVMFAAEEGGEKALQERVETGLLARLGYPVRTFIRSAAELRTSISACPYPAEAVSAGAGKLQIAFLADPLERRAREGVLALGSQDDRLALVGRELYWLPNGPMSASALDLKAIERVTGAMTVRTLGTVQQIAKRL